MKKLKISDTTKSIFKDKSMWALIIVTVTIMLCFDKGYISSGSMEPTLMTGKTVIYERVSKIFNGINRGDIVEFRKNGEWLSKRVIGIAGDKVEIKDGLVYVNGEKIDEPYLAEGAYTEAFASDTYEVPDGCVFLMGDNRLYSSDARLWDNPYIPLRDVKGKLLIILF